MIQDINRHLNNQYGPCRRIKTAMHCITGTCGLLKKTEEGIHSPVPGNREAE